MARPGRVRHPHARFQTGLTQVESGDPADHQFLFRYILHDRPPDRETNRDKAARGEPPGDRLSRTLVLVATMRSPITDSPGPN